MIDIKTKSAITVFFAVVLTFSTSALAANSKMISSSLSDEKLNIHTQLPLELKSIPYDNSYKIASVCALGAGVCDSNSISDGNSSSNNMNKRAQCIEESYKITTSDCKEGWTPINMCPHHSQYFKTCFDCTTYTLSTCPENSNCSSCHNKKLKIISCNNGYELSGNICQCPEQVSIDTGEKCSQSCEGNCVEKACKSPVSLTNPNDTCNQWCAMSNHICTSKSCTPSPSAATDCINGIEDSSDGCGGIRKVCRPDTPEAKCTRDGYEQNITCNTYEDTISCSGDNTYKKCAASCKSKIKERYGNTIHFDDERPEPYSSSTTTILTKDAQSSSLYLKAKVRSYLSYTDISECASLKTSLNGKVPTLTMPSYFSSITDIQDININTSVSSSQVLLKGRIANSVITFTNATKNAQVFIDSYNKLKISGNVTIQSSYPSSSPLLMRLDRSKNHDIGLEIADNSIFTFKGGIGCNLNKNYCTVNIASSSFAYNGIAIGTDATVNIEGDICFYGNRDILERAIIVGNNSNLNIVRGNDLVNLCLRETVMYIYGGAQVKLKSLCLLSWNENLESQQGGVLLKGINSRVYNTNHGISMKNDATSYVSYRRHVSEHNAWCDRDTINNNGIPAYKTPNFNCFRVNGYSNPQCSISFEGLPNKEGNPVCY